MITKLIKSTCDSMRGKFFEKGKPLAAFEPVLDALESGFIWVNQVTATGPHVRDHLDVKRLMSTVINAIMPCLLFGIWNTGHQTLLASGHEATFWASIYHGSVIVLPIVAVSYAVGGFWEFVFAVVRKHEINEGFLVTGLLFPLILPPTIPLWMVAMGVSFGVVIGKEVFGGTGMNILNPALLGRCFLFFAYPGQMSGEKVWIHGFDLFTRTPDVLSQATPLAVVAEGLGDPVTLLEQSGYSFWQMFLGCMPGSIGETSGLAVLLGAGLLLHTGIAHWRTMASVLVGAFFTAALYNALAGPGANALMLLPAHYHFVMGGFLFGMVFMATDPVSSATTDVGKIIYGLGVGFLAITIRVVNPAYPEGMMLAILFMNLFAPTFDYFVVKSLIARRAARATK